MTKETNLRSAKRTGSGMDSYSDARRIDVLFVILVAMYFVGSYFVSVIGRSQGVMITIMGQQAPLQLFAGVFSSVTNICIIFLVVFYGKTGFITSLVLMFGYQFPVLSMAIFKAHNVSSLSGVFANLFTLIAIVIIYLNDRKIRNYQKRLRNQAVLDALTGLPNRFGCNELINNMVKKGSRFAIVSIDLNNFKSINDTMGDDIGDRVLVEIASRWRKLAESGKSGTLDFIARLGGDEYALIIRGASSDKAITDTIKAYKEELEQKMTIDGCDYFLGACFGYAIFPDDDESGSSLFSFADAAMHEIKRLGSNNHILRFVPELSKAEENLEIERKIRAALDNDTVTYNLQPQFDINHKLRGFEALARMTDQDGKFISPGQFIPAAERSGLIDKVDLSVFKKSASFIADLINKTGADITLSINVSVKHLMKNNFLDELKEVIEFSKIPEKNLEIEITESIMIDSEKALQSVDEIKKMGVKVAIDDFGTGYSSLSYLNKLPADLLKIDKSFIDDMNTSESSRQYVASIISIGHILNLEVISEGVESEDQLQVLKSIGCDYIQGFVWGKPLPAEEAAKLVTSA